MKIEKIDLAVVNNFKLSGVDRLLSNIIMFYFGYFLFSAFIGTLLPNSFLYYSRLLYRVLILFFVYYCQVKYKCFTSFYFSSIIALFFWLLYVFFFSYDVTYNISNNKDLYYLKDILSEKFLPQILFVIGFIGILRKNQKLIFLTFYKMVGLFVISSFILILVSIFKYGTTFLFVEAEIYQGGVTLIRFSYYMVFISCIILYFIVISNDSKIKNKFILYFIVVIVMILLLGKRGSLLSVIVPCIFLTVFHKSNLITATLSVFFLLILSFFFYKNFDLVISFSSFFSERLATTLQLAFMEGDMNGREMIWEVAEDQISNHLFTGYMPVLVECSSEVFYYGLHPHSIWHELFMTGGVVLGVPFISYLVYVLFRCILLLINGNSIYLLFTIILISEIVHGSFSTPLYDLDLALCLIALSTFKINKKNKYARKSIVDYSSNFGRGHK